MASVTRCGGMMSTTGMGGVGKSTLAAKIARDAQVRAKFDRVCWVSVGQEPPMPLLQQTLYRQLLNKSLPDTVRSDDLLALGMLKEAAAGLSVLLVLDDVWAAPDATAAPAFLGRRSRARALPHLPVRQSKATSRPGPTGSGENGR